MTADPIPLHRQKVLARELYDLLKIHAPEDVYERLRTRVRDHKTNAADEVQQFRELRKACLEHPPLNEALQLGGFGDVAAMDPTHVTSEVGYVVQIFNAMIEFEWQDLQKPHFRKVFYTRDDLEPVK